MQRTVHKRIAKYWYGKPASRSTGVRHFPKILQWHPVICPTIRYPADCHQTMYQPRFIWQKFVHGRAAHVSTRESSASTWLHKNPNRSDSKLPELAYFGLFRLSDPTYSCISFFRTVGVTPGRTGEDLSCIASCGSQATRRWAWKPIPTRRSSRAPDPKTRTRSSTSGALHSSFPSREGRYQPIF
jgi:hypothetical protein